MPQNRYQNGPPPRETGSAGGSVPRSAVNGSTALPQHEMHAPRLFVWKNGTMSDSDLVDCRDCGMKLRPGFDTGGLCWRCVAHKATAIPAAPKAPTGTFIEGKMIPPDVHAEKIKQALSLIHISEPTRPY